MKLSRTFPFAAVALTTPITDELALAQQAQNVAQDERVTHERHYAGWLFRLLAALHNTDDPEAIAFLEQAREYQKQAREAFAAGDLAAAREFHRLAFRAVLSAVIEIFPDAPARTGEALDNALARIEEFLGDREAPRIRRILAHVHELRDAALAAEDPVDVLLLNVRGLQILHRLAHHIRWWITDHDREADESMSTVNF
jgi:hypothetical protein